MSREYNEIIEILKHISKEDFEKIPKDMIEMFKLNSDPDYQFNYDVTKTLQEQNVSKEARTIIAILFRDYWATEKQREKILNKEKQDIKILEEEKKKKYNPNEIFKKQIREEEKDNNIEKEEGLIKYKKSIFVKILEKIKKFFKIQNNI